jgi:hypothetical protein
MFRWAVSILAMSLLAAAPVIADDGADPGDPTRLRLLPVPIFITEPAVGQGLGASLMIIRPKDGRQNATAELNIAEAGIEVADGDPEPPDVTAVFGAYTDADTWVAGAAHSTSWRADRFRYLGLLMWTNVNSTVFLGDRPLDFNSKGVFLLQSFSARVGSSRFFLGGRLKANRSDTGFRLDLGQDDPIQVGLGETTDVGLALQAFFDSRDTTFTPNRGQYVSLNVWRHDTSFGSDFDYWKTEIKALSFHPLSGDVVLGLRAEGAVASGDPPFWGYPWVTLRGVPAMRYQDERVLAVEAELRWNLRPQWAVIGFFGGGMTDGDLVQYESQDPFGAGGVGGRYLFAAELGLWVGADLARGPEDTVFYIQVGHAW